MYVHHGTTSTAQIEKGNSDNSATTEGTKVGETIYSGEFAEHDGQGDIIGSKNGNFANNNARIYFGVSMDGLMNKFNSIVANLFTNMSIFAGKAWLKG